MRARRWSRSTGPRAAPAPRVPLPRQCEGDANSGIFGLALSLGVWASYVHERYGRLLVHEDLDAALEALPRPRTVLAGGTDYYPARVGQPCDEDILDITALRGCARIEERTDHWRIGALTTWSALAQADLPPWFDGLRLAAREVGGEQIQNAGTLGGNLCNASPAADGVPPLLALDAAVELAALEGREVLPLAEFILGNRRTARRPDQLLTAVLVPKPRAARAGGHFLKLGARRYLVISIVMAGATLEVGADGRIAAARLAVGACAPVGAAPAASRGGAPRSALRPAPRRPGAARASGRPRADRRRPGERRLSQRRRVDARAAHRERAGAAAMTGLAPAPAAPPIAAEPGVGFTVNGRRVRIAAPPIKRLAAVLRDDLGLTGTKVGCNAGDCGACTVLLDGAQICACLVPLGQVAGRRVVTVEGLARDGRLAPLQRAFQRHGAAQCGICTPGMLMAASDLLARESGPDGGRDHGRARRRPVPLHRLSEDRRGDPGPRRQPRLRLRRRPARRSAPGSPRSTARPSSPAPSATAPMGSRPTRSGSR